MYPGKPGPKSVACPGCGVIYTLTPQRPVERCPCGTTVKATFPKVNTK